MGINTQKKILEYKAKNKEPETVNTIAKNLRMNRDSVKKACLFLAQLGHLKITTDGHITLVEANEGVQYGTYQTTRTAKATA